MHIALDQNGRKEHCLLIESNQRTQIRFAIESEKKSDSPGRAKRRQSVDVRKYGRVGRLALGRRQFSPGSSNLSSY